MRYSCRAVVGHGQSCEPNYQCEACAAKQKYIPRIEKLEAALREIAQTVTIEDESWHPSYHDPRFTQKQAEGLAEALSARIKISRKALEGKDD
jgi:hypothetical protein